MAHFFFTINLQPLRCWRRSATRRRSAIITVRASASSWRCTSTPSARWSAGTSPITCWRSLGYACRAQTSGTTTCSTWCALARRPTCARNWGLPSRTTFITWGTDAPSISATRDRRNDWMRRKRAASRYRRAASAIPSWTMLKGSMPSIRYTWNFFQYIRYKSQDLRI